MARAYSTVVVLVLLTGLPNELLQLLLLAFATGDLLPVFSPATGVLLPFSPARYKRLLPVFLASLA